MIGIDTNVLVRHLAQDDPAQSAKATEVIERRLSAEEPGFVSVVVMAELAWVLERSYGLPDSEIAVALERVIQTSSLSVENEKEVFDALMALKEGRGSFGDALIAALGASAGCAHTLTFDRKALRLPGFAAV
jgi:predicted nucleic-acid-binding protein